LVVILAILALTAAPTGAAVPKAPKNFLGVVPQDTITRADTMRMKRGNVTNARLAIQWSHVEPEPGVYNFDYVDSLVRVAAREGVRVMPTLYGTPGWMGKVWTRLPVENSNQLKRWRLFVREMVERYGVGGDFWTAPAQVESKLPRLPVVDWQIWNEVNFHYFATPVSPGRYARLVKASSSVIRAINGRANIVLGGLYARPKGSPSRARSANTYLSQLARLVPRSAYDTIAIHPYAKNTATLRQYMRSYRAAANRAGLGNKPIFIDEMGWGSGRATNAFLLGSKQAQARQVRSAFTYLLGDRRRLKLRKVYWFAWKDKPRSEETCSFCYSIGLFEPGKALRAKPAWRTFVAFTRGRP
jgi:hypothetical protein